MPPRITWRNLLPGIVAVAALVSIAIGLIAFGGVGGVKGDTIRLYVLTNQAQGVIDGTEVWLVGQKIGIVDRVEFRPVSADSGARVLLVLTVKEKVAGQIRQDSEVQARTGGSVIGPIVVSISAGTPKSPAVRGGDTLRAHSQADMVVTGSKLSGATQELGPLMADVRTVLAQARSRSKSVQGSLIEEHNGDVAQLRGNVTRIREMFAGPKRAADVMTHARAALAQVDSIRALVNSPSTSYGRFKRDSALGATVETVRNQLSRVQAQLESVDGNIGRLKKDDALTRAVTQAKQEMTLLFNDIRRRPSRYIAF